MFEGAVAGVTAFDIAVDGCVSITTLSFAELTPVIKAISATDEVRPSNSSFDFVTVQPFQSTKQKA